MGALDFRFPVGAPVMSWRPPCMFTSGGSIGVVRADRGVSTRPFTLSAATSSARKRSIAADGGGESGAIIVNGGESGSINPNWTR